MIGQAYAKLASPTFTGTVTAADLTTTGNTILGNAATDTLNVGAGGLVKDASGNVGIGTASPTQNLQVGSFADTGAQYLRVSGSVADIYLGQSASNLFGFSSTTCAYIFQDSPNNTALAIGTLGANSLNFGTNNSNRVTIDSSGNVLSGLTTSAPTLTVNSQMVFNLTSDTNLRISVRGSDGATRTANITLA